MVLYNFRHAGLVLICFFWYFSVVQSKRCSKPLVRREWKSLTTAQRSDWIRAVKCFSKLPHADSLVPAIDPAISLIPPVNKSSSLYDDLVYVHMDLNVRIHRTGLFLPWHRAYTKAFEDILRNKCQYKGAQPYWNWAEDAANAANPTDFFNSPIFDPSPKTGFGGNGDPKNDWQIKDGAFSDFVRAYPVPHVVRRNFTILPWAVPGLFISTRPIDPTLLATTAFSQAQVEILVNGFRGDFVAFQDYIEQGQGVHSGPHLTIGADMRGTCPQNAPVSCVGGPKWSANDPLFFLHHAMVDKIWSDWQNRYPENFWSFQGGSLQAISNVSEALEYPNGGPPWLNLNSPIPSDGVYEEYSLYDVMDIKGEKMCYVYE